MFSDSTRLSPKHVTGDDTRARLIAAATDVFLEDGFRAARVQTIAHKAGLRLSAINYHFGSKEGLYLAVLQHHAEQAVALTPLAPPHAGLSLRQRFDFAIHALVLRLLDTRNQSRIGPLMLRELVNPTAALDVLIERFTLPQGGQMLALLREVMGPDVPDEVVGRALASVFGQCAIYILARPVLSRLVPAVLEDPAMLDSVSEHVAELSWAGLFALRAKHAKPQENSRDSA